MNNNYILNELKSYTNSYDLQKKFPSFLTEQLDNTPMSEHPSQLESLKNIINELIEFSDDSKKGALEIIQSKIDLHEILESNERSGNAFLILGGKNFSNMVITLPKENNDMDVNKLKPLIISELESLDWIKLIKV
jgi:hypothetical protein